MPNNKNKSKKPKFRAPKSFDGIYLLLGGILCIIIIISLVQSTICNNSLSTSTSNSETFKYDSATIEFKEDDSYTYNEDAFVSASLEAPNRTYTKISNLELSSNLLTASKSQAALDSIVDFFSFAFPEISSLTVYNYAEEKESNVSESITFNLSSGSHLFKVRLDSEKESTKDPNFLLTIFSEKDQPIFSYSGENSFDYTDYSTESLATNMIDHLPYNSYLDNGTPFSLYYFNSNGNTLEIEIDSENYFPEFCSEAKQKSLNYLTSFTTYYSDEISEDNLTCTNEAGSF